MTNAEAIPNICPQHILSRSAMSDESRCSDITALTDQMVRGEEAAYREFFGGYFDRLLRYLLVVTRGQEEVAREALQMTFLRVVRHVRRFDSEPAFWSWLTVLARSSIADEGRKQRRYGTLLDGFFQHEKLAADKPAADGDDNLLGTLEREMTELPCDERDLLERKYFERQSVKAIAAALDSTEKAIESRLVRIRRKLKDTILKRLKQ